MAISAKATVPKPFDVNKSYDIMKGALRRVAPWVKQYFGVTYATWTHKPTWEEAYRFTATRFSYTYVTYHQIYSWVSHGTRAHMVPKSGTATMAFPSAYTAKTSPGRLRSGGGGASGPTIIRTGAWMVSGIEPRNFDKLVAKRIMPVLLSEGNAAMARIRTMSGHG